MVVKELLRLLVPGLAGELLAKGIQAAEIIVTAFASDETRREAEFAVMIAELQAGKTPTIVLKVIA